MPLRVTLADQTSKPGINGDLVQVHEGDPELPAQGLLDLPLGRRGELEQGLAQSPAGVSLVGLLSRLMVSAASASPDCRSRVARASRARVNSVSGRPYSSAGGGGLAWTGWRGGMGIQDAPFSPAYRTTRPLQAPALIPHSGRWGLGVLHVASARLVAQCPDRSVVDSSGPGASRLGCRLGRWRGSSARA